MEYTHIAMLFIAIDAYKGNQSKAGVRSGKPHFGA
jgi:hypothetical protein